MSIRVVVADDQELMRSALRLCAESEPDIEVVGEASDGREAIELCRRLVPDVVLMDLRMPLVDGVAATRVILEDCRSRVRVLVITGFDDDEYIVEALRAGASGFLVKDATASDVVQAVRVIADGGALLSPSVTRRLLDGYARYLPRRAPTPEVTARLTDRELTVLRLVCRGWSNAQIAESLHVAQSSVKTHVGHLLTKLGVTDRVQLVIFSYENGLIRPGTESSGQP